MPRKAIVVSLFAVLVAAPAGAQSLSLGGGGVTVGLGVAGLGAGIGLGSGGVSVGGASIGGVTVGGLTVGTGGLPGGSTPVIGGAGAGAVGATAPAASLAGSFSLPARLLPGDDRAGRPRKLVPAKIPGLGTVRVTEESIRRGAVGPLPAASGTPLRAVAACRQALAQAARRYGAVHATAASAGPIRQSASGHATAPIEMRIVYARRGAYEVRQSRVQCRLAGGQVVGVS